jgi:hypothetical protein
MDDRQWMRRRRNGGDREAGRRKQAGDNQFHNSLQRQNALEIRLACRPRSRAQKKGPPMGRPFPICTAHACRKEG